MEFTALTHLELEAHYGMSINNSSQPALFLLAFLAGVTPACPNLQRIAFIVHHYGRGTILNGIIDFFELEDEWLRHGGKTVVPLAHTTTDKLKRVDVKLETQRGGRGIANPDRFFEFFGRAWVKGVAEMKLNGFVLDWEAEMREENGVRICAFKERLEPK
jgi:hypothetical protein